MGAPGHLLPGDALVVHGAQLEHLREDGTRRMDVHVGDLHAQLVLCNAIITMVGMRSTTHPPR